jgi:hypothetical protein
MSVKDKIISFNSIIESFLNQISPMVGTTYYVYFKKVIKINSLIAIENAAIYMIPLKNKIFNEDESYFINDELYINKINEDPALLNVIQNNNINNDSFLQEIFRLKDIYNKLDEKSKKNVWQILQALLQLSIEYCELKGIQI